MESIEIGLNVKLFKPIAQIEGKHWLSEIADRCMICLFLIPWDWCCNSKSHGLGRIGKGFSLNQLLPLKVLRVVSCYVVIFVCVLLVCC